MTNDNKEFTVPDFGPADEPTVVKEERLTQHQDGDSIKPSSKPQQENTSESSKEYLTQNESWFTRLVLILLTASCGALGYFGFDSYQNLQLQIQKLDQADQRILQLEEQLLGSKVEGTKTTLAERVALVESAAANQAEKYNIELNALSQKMELSLGDGIKQHELNQSELKTLKAAQEEHAKNLETKLEAQLAKAAKEAQLSQVKIKTALQKELGLDFKQELKSKLEKQASLMATLNEELEQVVTKVATIQKQATEQKQRTKNNETKLTEQMRALSAIETQIAILEESYLAEQSGIAIQAKSQSAKLKQLEQGQKSLAAKVSSRITANEQDIKSINGSRRMFVNEVNALKAQINQIKAVLN